MDNIIGSKSSNGAHSMVWPQKSLTTPRLKQVCGLLVGLLALGACQTIDPPAPKYNPKPTPMNQSEAASYKSANLRPYIVHGKTYTPIIPKIGTTQRGGASWYGYESPNRTTANGEPFDTDLVAAAHKTWPLPSIVEVKNLDNQKTLRLRLNDRGPFVDGRIIDLSREAAKRLGVYKTGTARVEITFLGPAPKWGLKSAIPSHTNSSDQAINGHTQSIIQLGSFTDLALGREFQKTLRDEGIRAKSLTIGARIIYYVGPYSTAQKARSELKELQEAGYADAFVKSWP